MKYREGCEPSWRYKYHVPTHFTLYVHTRRVNITVILLYNTQTHTHTCCGATARTTRSSCRRRNRVIAVGTHCAAALSLAQLVIGCPVKSRQPRDFDGTTTESVYQYPTCRRCCPLSTGLVLFCSFITLEIK